MPFYKYLERLPKRPLFLLQLFYYHNRLQYYYRQHFLLCWCYDLNDCRPPSNSSDIGQPQQLASTLTLSDIKVSFITDFVSRSATKADIMNPDRCSVEISRRFLSVYVLSKKEKITGEKKLWVGGGTNLPLFREQVRSSYE